MPLPASVIRTLLALQLQNAFHALHSSLVLLDWLSRLSAKRSAGTSSIQPRVNDSNKQAQRQYQVCLGMRRAFESCRKALEIGNQRFRGESLNFPRIAMMTLSGPSGL